MASTPAPSIEPHDVAAALGELAVLMEIAGANPFKIRAHENAARTIEQGDFDLIAEVRGGTLGKRKGFGEGLVKRITAFVETGSMEELEELREQIPPGLLQMLHIQGFGPKKIQAVWKQLDITTIDALETACEEERIRDLKGFGAKTEKNILEGIRLMRSHAGQTLWSMAWAKAQPLVEALRTLKQVQRVEIAGSLRRRKEVVKDIDIVASSDDPAAVMDAFVKLDGIEEVIAKGETKTAVRLRRGLQCDLRVVSDEQFPFTLAHFTGSKEHNVAMRGRAQRKFNIRVSEYGLFDESKGGELIPCENEGALYERLGLDFIPPEMREDMGEIEAAENRALPKLITNQDLRGTLHMHTTYSDGKESLETMARASADMGFAWVGFADHSVAAHYAGGMTPEQVHEQFDLIERLNESGEIPIHIFKGIEVDILSDGSVDYDEEIWKRSDYLVASVHSGFKMSREDMTTRVCRALENPWVTILGHPTGRLLLSREAYQIDLETVIEKAAETGRMIEINANPRRLDLDWRLLRRARDAGVMLSIGPDAHSIPMLSDIWTGVGIARKGWLTAKDVLNTRTVKDAAKAFQATRKS